ncbi:Uncharacterized membrane protein [Mesonia phycicola]|uniref:Uncharacterized membrane protein n=2 Tax=Mesonia phycicola TaxID=579105 RepID=A0A1M6GF61_9FLAO|nr:Uncharacterized membrane protein [Mesonia phycicola]
MNYPWHLYLMGFIYIIAGINHFIKPKIYLRIMPRYLPKHQLLVYASGALEVIFGVGVCISITKEIAIYGIITLLVLFFSVHFYMLSSKKASAGLPKWLLIIRIPLQFVLIYWAYYYLAL